MRRFLASITLFLAACSLGPKQDDPLTNPGIVSSSDASTDGGERGLGDASTGQNDDTSSTPGTDAAVPPPDLPGMCPSDADNTDAPADGDAHDTDDAKADDAKADANGDARQGEAGCGQADAATGG